MIELIKAATAAASNSERQVSAPRPIEPSAAVATRNAETDDKSQSERRTDIARMQAAIEQLAESALSGSRLSIEKAENAGLYVYNLVDKETGSVVRQYPQKELVELKEYLRTRQAGLVDERA